MNTPSDSHQSRREFLVAAAAAGIALSVRPVCAQTMIVTPSDGLDVGDTKITARDGTPIAVYFAAPKRAGKFATVLVIPRTGVRMNNTRKMPEDRPRPAYFPPGSRPTTASVTRTK